MVQSQKTAHLGKPTRTIPLFAELKEHLETSFEMAPEGAVYVIDERFRKARKPSGWGNCNLRTAFQKIIRRAGLTQWPRLFQNLRASRETELAEQFPVQVVAGWLGNTPAIAMRHYLMTTQEHFAKAVNGDQEHPTQKAAHNPAQQLHEMPRKVLQADSAAHEETPVLQGCASHCDYVQNDEVELCGLEYPELGDGASSSRIIPVRLAADHASESNAPISEGRRGLPTRRLGSGATQVPSNNAPRTA